MADTTSQEESKSLTVADVERIYKISRKTQLRMRKAGLLPYWLARSSIRYQQSSLVQIIADAERASVAQSTTAVAVDGEVD
ncbi:helix-turn-helix domain-containing protein [Mycolicibacterium llatzerense]|uniref:helix-turn-helix domain-containing protein n=1 Tax=Mycolicibacterium llatzerense TaxID=280871 RepID=UPI0008DC613F|nr:helix-turn-helix domain-containing protein [Mycolicibacterium llatzerense]